MWRALQEFFAQITAWEVWLVDAVIALGHLALGSLGVLIGVAFSGFILLFASDIIHPAVALLGLVPAVMGGHRVSQKGLPAFSRPFSDAAGNARLGTLRDLKKERLVDAPTRDQVRGLYCGRFKGHAVFYLEDRHAVSFGPTRIGKCTRLQVPNICLLDRSMVILDPKGELAAITAHMLRLKYGDDAVLCINPFNALVDDVFTKGRKKGQKKYPWLSHLRSCGFDPMADPDFYAASSRFFSKAAEIAESCIKLDHVNLTQHWALRARELITALVMYAKITETPQQRATMSDVVSMLMLPYDSDDKTKKTLKKVFERIAAHPEKEISDLGGSFLTNDDEHREINDVLATVRGQVSCLRDKTIVRDMSHHPMVRRDPADRKSRPEPFTFDMLKDRKLFVFIILPPKMLEIYAVWVRLLISNALNSLMSRGEGDIVPLVMIDEAGALGHMLALKSAMTMGAGGGVRAWPFFQSIDQLITAYGEKGYQSFMQGAGVTTSFRTGDDDTANYLSTRMGNQSAVTETYNFDPKKKTKTLSKTVGGYPLMHRMQFGALGKGKMVGWFDPSPLPYLVDAPAYYDMRLRHLQPNPYKPGFEREIAA